MRSDVVTCVPLKASLIGFDWSVESIRKWGWSKVVVSEGGYMTMYRTESFPADKAA